MDFKNIENVLYYFAMFGSSICDAFVMNLNGNDFIFVSVPVDELIESWLPIYFVFFFCSHLTTTIKSQTKYSFVITILSNSMVMVISLNLNYSI